MQLQLANFVRGRLSAGITAAATSIPLTTAAFPALAQGTFCYAVLQSATDRSVVEIVKVTAGGATLTVERGQEGTTARDFAANDIIEQRLTAVQFQSVVDHSNDSKTHVPAGVAGKFLKGVVDGAPVWGMPTASEVGAVPTAGGDMTGPLGVKTLQGQGSSIPWGSLDISGSKGGYAGINFSDTGHWFGILPTGLSGVWKSDGNSKWYFNESGVLTGGAKILWDTIIDHPSRTNWASKAYIPAIVTGQLAWKNFGNGHTIFDASAGTSPDGTAVDKNNSQIAWGINYPALMGWNGTTTYGVRVDSARTADSAVAATTAVSLDGGTIKTLGQDLTIHGKRAMVGAGDSNLLTINYANDWGSTLIQGQTYLQTVESNRHVVVHNGSTVYSNSGLEVRTTDGSDARIGFHRSGHSAGSINHNSWGFQFEREPGAGSRANVAAANFFADAAQDTSGNALTRLDYVHSKTTAFGLGTSSPVSRQNWNEVLQPTGWYEYNGDGGDSGGAAGYGEIHTITSGNAGAYDGWAKQVFYSTGGDVFHRTSKAGGFSGKPWYKFWDSNNFNPNNYLNATTGGTVSGDITINTSSIRGANGAAIVRDHGNGNTTFSGSRNASSVAGDLYLGYHDNTNHFTNKVLLCKSMYSDSNQNLQIIDYSNGALFDKGAAVIGANRDNILNNPSFGVGFLSAHDGGAQWIAGYFGKNGGSNQVVIGELAGGATIGGHNAAKNSWADLYIGTQAGGGGNYITHISMPYARMQGNSTSYEVFHRGMFNPDEEKRFVARGDAADCNTAVANGHYRLTPSTANNAVINYGHMFTVSEGWGAGNTGAWLQQTAYMHDGTIWTRRSVNNTWHGWTRLWDSAGFNPDSKLSENGHYGGTLKLNNWFRSVGASGWYNETYGGGIWMDESSTVKIYGGKNFHAPAKINCEGDVTTAAGLIGYSAYVNGPQQGSANALTRKDYVDSRDWNTRWENKQVPNHTGGNANSHYESEWDGDRVTNAPSPSWYFFRELYHSGGANWRHQEAFDFHSDEEWFRRGINAADYSPWHRRWHSGNFNPDSKANLSGATFSGNVNVPTINGLALRYASNADTVAVRDSSGDLAVRLLRSEYNNQSDMYGAIAFRGDSSSNNFLRFCSDPAAVRQWLQVGGDRFAAATTLYTGSTNTHPTNNAINLPSASLAAYRQIRFEFCNSGNTIVTSVTLSYDAWAAMCASGKLMFIASGGYSYTFEPATVDARTLYRNTSANCYLTKIVGLI